MSEIFESKGTQQKSWRTLQKKVSETFLLFPLSIELAFLDFFLIIKVFFYFYKFQSFFKIKKGDFPPECSLEKKNLPRKKKKSLFFG